MVFDVHCLSQLQSALYSTLPHWEIPKTAEITLLSISENALWLVSDSLSKRKWIIRLHRPNYHNDTEILSELAWIEALQKETIIRIPRPIRCRDSSFLQSVHVQNGTSYRVVVFDYLHGKEPLIGSNLTSWFKELGNISAILHQQSRKWKKPDFFTRKRWDFNNLIGPNAYWGNWRNAFNLDKISENILNQACKLLHRQTESYSYSADRFGLIHCDMRLANLLVHHQKLALIDFDDCGFCWFTYDFAASVSFMEHEPFIDDLKESWIKGYQQQTTLSKDEIESLPIFILLRRIQLTAWIATHAETKTAQYLKDHFTEGTVFLAKSYLKRYGAKT